jgi:hypothetical protein
LFYAREYVEALEEEMKEKRKYEATQSYLKEAQEVVSMTANILLFSALTHIVNFIVVDGRSE